MKYIKTYEQIKNVVDPWNRAKGDDGGDHEVFDIGDIVICVENRPGNQLKIGNEYKIIDKKDVFWSSKNNHFYYEVRNIKTGRKIGPGGWAAYHFTKDVEEFKIRKKKKKYNL
jgi:hypothetical protein